MVGDLLLNIDLSMLVASKSIETLVRLFHINAEVLLDRVVCSRRLTPATLMLDSPHSLHAAVRLCSWLRESELEFILQQRVGLLLLRRSHCTKSSATFSDTLSIVTHAFVYSTTVADPVRVPLPVNIMSPP